MATYKVCIKELVSSEFEVTAGSPEAAKEIAVDKYLRCNFVVANTIVDSRTMAIAERGQEYPDYQEF